MSESKPEFKQTTEAVSILTVQKEDYEEYRPTEEEEADNRAWEEQFKNSHDFLNQLALETCNERRQRMTVPLETVFDD